MQGIGGRTAGGLERGRGGEGGTDRKGGTEVWWGGGDGRKVGAEGMQAGWRACRYLRGIQAGKQAGGGGQARRGRPREKAGRQAVGIDGMTDGWNEGRSE